MLLPHKLNQSLDVPPAAYITPDLRAQVLNIDNILQICSIICSILIILGYIFIRTVDKTLDRLSLRLIIYSCFLNIIFGICQMLLNNFNFEDAEHACDAVMVFFVFSDMCASLLLTCIAINLWIHIVHKSRVTVSASALEAIYVCGCLLLTAFTAITPFFSPTDVYHYSESLNQCWFVTSVPPKPIETFWQLWLFHVWQLSGVIAALFAFVSVIITLRREELSIDDHIASAQASVNKWFDSDDKLSSNFNGHPEQINLEFEHNMEEPKSNPSKRPSVVSNLSRRTIERGKTGCCYMLKFWLPRRAFSSHRKIRKTAIHASIRQSRNISYVAKTIRQVICYSLVLIITQIFNFASFIDFAVYSRYLPVYYILGFVSTGAKGPLLLLCFMVDPALWSAINVKRRSRNEKKALRTTDQPPAPTIAKPAAPEKAATPPLHNVLDISRILKDRGYSDKEVSSDDISVMDSEGGPPESTIGLGEASVNLENQLVECSRPYSRAL